MLNSVKLPKEAVYPTDFFIPLQYEKAKFYHSAA